MKNRFDFEEMIMKFWHVTDDLDMLADIVGETKMDARDQDRLFNVVIGMKELYDYKFSKLFEAFEQMIKEGKIK